jgi:UDP-N-acetylglucosamine:LPS N-acetylglucosamine transferase
MRGLAEYLNKIACVLVICDIAPMGIAVAQAAGITSVLVENFTWDWIYQNYASYDARMGEYINYLQNLFGATDYHIQTEPVCRCRNADLTTLPVSRRARTPSKVTRGKLGIPDGAKAVLVTMGGMQHRYTFSEQLTNLGDVYFIIPGGSQSMQLRENLVLLPHHSDFFHPDLMNACDAVIGKVGYSTVAETYYTGIPYGYVTRPSFPESDVLAAYIEREMSGFPISETEFQEVFWVSQLTEFLSLPRIERSGSNGAVQSAQFIYRLLEGEKLGSA